jgi:hypothetical protein
MTNTKNIHLSFAPAALALCEVLLRSLFEANALNGTMSYQAHAFGKISDALVETIACAIADSMTIYFDDARTIARLLHDEAIDNGENIAYQVNLFNEGQISL